MQPIYIADDSADQRFLLSLFLRRINPDYQILFFDRAQGLLDALSFVIQAGGNLPFIIFLDLQMPEMDGYTALKEIKQAIAGESSRTEVPVAIYSSYSDPHTIKKCLDAGALSFLQKPVDPDELKDLLVSLQH